MPWIRHVAVAGLAAAALTGVAQGFAQTLPKPGPSLAVPDEPAGAAVAKRIAAAKSEVERCEQRLAWSERMAARGLIGKAQVEADRLRLQRARAALEEVKQQLRSRLP
jgi:membrane-bound lytic murein transglycosylase B